LPNVGSPPFVFVGNTKCPPWSDAESHRTDGVFTPHVRVLAAHCRPVARSATPSNALTVTKRESGYPAEGHGLRAVSARSLSPQRRGANVERRRCHPPVVVSRSPPLRTACTSQLVLGVSVSVTEPRRPGRRLVRARRLVGQIGRRAHNRRCSDPLAGVWLSARFGVVSERLSELSANMEPAPSGGHALAPLHLRLIPDATVRCI
jgi:hypothetical protein